MGTQRTIPYLDAANGDFCFMPGFIIHKGMVLEQMPANGFSRRDFMGNKQNHTYFSLEPKPVFDENEWWITVQFIEDKLASVYIQVFSPPIRQMTDGEYYSSGEERLAFHKHELKKLVAKPGKMPWGSAVTHWERKSENTGICILYK